MAKKNPDKPKIIDEKIEPEAPKKKSLLESGLDALAVGGIIKSFDSVDELLDDLHRPDEAVEEAQPVSQEPTSEPDLRAAKTIYVTIAPYSSAYKKLAIEQHKTDPSLVKGAVVLLGRQFNPGRNYSIEETQEVLKLIKDGLLISMTGSFRFKVRDEPKAKEESSNADN